ncbi:MAG: DNA repair protein RadA [Phycisphaeraceae bacterium]|nr:DNA repair protein RadA [Phycisphaeraceae bacterium]
MAKPSKRFVCRQCGSVHAKWLGRCPDCGQWDGLEEFTVSASSSSGGGASGGGGHASLSAEVSALLGPSTALPICQVVSPEAPRLSTHISELDRVLGESSLGAGEEAQKVHGMVPGSTILVGGDPGIGKSTLMLQAAEQLARQGHRVLYVSSEESAQQTRLRAQRLGAGSENLLVLAETQLDRIGEQIRKANPAVVVIDSIQMIFKSDLPAAPGSIAQLRACGTELVLLAKTAGIAMFLVGHVTKQGQLAGPRLLEHMVDTVLYFEGDRYHSHRIVRAVKNRFGATLEIGLFEMTESGLRQAPQGAGVFIQELQPANGSVVCPVVQGSRCVLVEIQALTATGFLGAAKRKTSGLDGNRLAMLIAVLEKHGGLRLADQDIFASSVGGMKIGEPGADLAIALAIAGAHLNRRLLGPTAKGAAVFGEIGLGGEVRRVDRLEQRIKESARLGFSRIICPQALPSRPPGCEVIPVPTLAKAMELLS